MEGFGFQTNNTPNNATNQPTHTQIINQTNNLVGFYDVEESLMAPFERNDGFQDTSFLSPSKFMQSFCYNQAASLQPLPQGQFSTLHPSQLKCAQPFNCDQATAEKMQSESFPSFGHQKWDLNENNVNSYRDMATENNSQFATESNALNFTALGLHGSDYNTTVTQWAQSSVEQHMFKSAPVPYQPLINPTDAQNFQKSSASNNTFVALPSSTPMDHLLNPNGPPNKRFSFENNQNSPKWTSGNCTPIHLQKPSQFLEYIQSIEATRTQDYFQTLVPRNTEQLQVNDPPLTTKKLSTVEIQKRRVDWNAVFPRKHLTEEPELIVMAPLRTRGTDSRQILPTEVGCDNNAAINLSEFFDTNSIKIPMIKERESAVGKNTNRRKQKHHIIIGSDNLKFEIQTLEVNDNDTSTRQRTTNINDDPYPETELAEINEIFKNKNNTSILAIAAGSKRPYFVPEKSPEAEMVPKEQCKMINAQSECLYEHSLESSEGPNCKTKKGAVVYISDSDSGRKIKVGGNSIAQKRTVFKCKGCSKLFISTRSLSFHSKRCRFPDSTDFQSKDKDKDEMRTLNNSDVKSSSKVIKMKKELFCKNDLNAALYQKECSSTIIPESDKGGPEQTLGDEKGCKSAIPQNGPSHKCRKCSATFETPSSLSTHLEQCILLAPKDLSADKSKGKTQLPSKNDCKASICRKDGKSISSNTIIDKEDTKKKSESDEGNLTQNKQFINQNLCAPFETSRSLSTDSSRCTSIGNIKRLPKQNKKKQDFSVDKNEIIESKQIASKSKIRPLTRSQTRSSTGQIIQSNPSTRFTRSINRTKHN